jgi:hypothetical protein
LEIPVSGEDKLLTKYVKQATLPERDVWEAYFAKTLEEWSKDWCASRITDVRNWIYICLQRNLRWSDVIQLWVEQIYKTDWIDKESRKELLEALWKAESGGGWTLVTSYRIPILWEHVHLNFAKTLHKIRSSKQGDGIHARCSC